MQWIANEKITDKLNPINKAVFPSAELYLKLCNSEYKTSFREKFKLGKEVNSQERESQQQTELMLKNFEDAFVNKRITSGEVPSGIVGNPKLYFDKFNMNNILSFSPP
jgi:hypothetical protein